MNPKIAQNIMTLLMRIDIKGAEVPAFNECMNALHAETTVPFPPEPPEKPAKPEKTE